MYLDKIYTLQTGVSLKISTLALQELIANGVTGHQLPELKNFHCTADLYTYLSIIVYEGAEELIKRRCHWMNNKIKTDLTAGQPVSFNGFCNIFWRSLDEDDPDGDEWYRLIASDQFHTQLVILLNKLRIAERNLQQYNEMLPDLYLESA